jgi:hypothetical protein
MAMDYVLSPHLFFELPRRASPPAAFSECGSLPVQGGNCQRGGGIIFTMFDQTCDLRTIMYPLSTTAE